MKNGGSIFSPKTKKPITMSFHLMCYRLCVYASGSLETDIFSCPMLIRVSCLHLGQNSGKFTRTVSSRILTLVLLLQKGHNIQLSFLAFTGNCTLLVLFPLKEFHCNSCADDCNHYHNHNRKPSIWGRQAKKSWFHQLDTLCHWKNAHDFLHNCGHYLKGKCRTRKN